jgi:quercetin dioxygenase-like cupin family protein
MTMQSKLGRAIRSMTAGGVFLLWAVALGAGPAAAQGRGGGVPEAEMQAQLAQRVVNVVDEPRHRTMFVYNDDVRVLDVRINIGDRTLQHTHDTAIHYVFISQANGPTDGRIQSVTSYVDEPVTHAVSNGGPNRFQIIAMPNASDPVANLTANRPTGLSLAVVDGVVTGEPALENPWYRTYRVDLAPGQQTPVHRHYNPVLIVQVNDGKVHVTRDDGITAELTEMGQFTWRNPESPYQIRNTGTTPLGVVIVEARGTRMED